MKMIKSTVIALAIGIPAMTTDGQSFTIKDVAAFLNSPPEIETLVFERHRESSRADRKEYFQVTWSSEAFLIRKADSLREFAINRYTDNQIYGAYDGFTWYFMLTGNNAVFIDEHGRYADKYLELDVDGHTGHTAKHLKRRAALQLSPMLNLGVLGVEPGTVRCIGNTINAIDGMRGRSQESFFWIRRP